MIEVITEVISRWDPIGLMGFAPPDEYDYECRLILNEYEKAQESLEMIIYKVFIENFGKEIQVNQEICCEIASEIISKIKRIY